jgi:DNA-binding response OmpR family regulator
MMGRACVLIADDETHIVQVLALKFRNAGIDVVEARDGEEALDLVRETSPDVVVTDLQMPFMSGADLARAMYEDPATASIPVLVLTARGWALDDSIESLPNVHGVHNKPFSPRALLQIVEALLDGGVCEDQAA